VFTSHGFFKWDILKRSEAWKIIPWLRLIFSDTTCMNAHVIARVISIYPLHSCHVGVYLHHELSTMHDPWLSHCTSPSLCMNCWKSSKHLYIGACWCPQEAVICPYTTWLERPTLRDERYVKKFSNLLYLTKCGFHARLEEGGLICPNMSKAVPTNLQLSSFQTSQLSRTKPEKLLLVFVRVTFWSVDNFEKWQLLS
jgi:hypothetical protein